MFIPQPIRKWIAVFRGDVAATLILLSVLLGFWFGLTPGWYGLHVALLLVALIVNIHFGIFLLSAALGKAVCFAAAPLLYHTGVFVQDALPAVLQTAARIPVLAITDFSRYAVAGALLLGPVIGFVLGVILAISVQTFRRTWLKFQDESEGFQRWRSKGWVRFLDRLLIGKGVADVRGVLQRRPRWVRLPGVILALIVAGGSAAALTFVENEDLAKYAARSLTAANGAEVNIAGIELEALAGKASVSGVQVTDPAQPMRNRVAVENLSAQVSYWDLLLGRIVMEDVSVAGVVFDAPRTQAGEVLVPPSPPAPETFDSGQYNIPSVDVERLESYFADGKELQQQLESASEWLPSRTPESESPPVGRQVPESYLAYLAAKADVPATPRIIIRRLAVDDVDLPIPQLGLSRVVCANLSDAPAQARLPVVIEITSKAHKTLLKAECRYDRATGGAQITGTFDEVPLAELQNALKQSNPVVFTGGTASAVLTGNADRETVDLSMAVQTKGLQASATGAAMGLDAQVVGEAMKVLENLKTTLRLVGPWTAPRLAFDTQALAGSFRDALVGAGKAELARRADALIAKEFGDRVPGLPGAADMLEKPEDAVKNVVGGLLEGQLPGKSDGKKSGDAAKEDPAQDIKDTLGGLLGGKKGKDKGKKDE